MYKPVLRIFFLLFIVQLGNAQGLPQRDWLIEPITDQVTIDSSEGQLVFSNGLLRRSFLLQPNFSCVDFLNLSTQQQLIRSIEPEARITLNGIAYRVGGAGGQKEKAYWQPAFSNRLTTSDSDFRYKRLFTKAIESCAARFDPKYRATKTSSTDQSHERDGYTIHTSARPTICSATKGITPR